MSSYMQISQKFYDAFKHCGFSLKSPHIARKLHAQLILSGLDTSLFLLNNLLHMYSNCALLHDAFQVFQETNHRNIFTWNTMIHALVDSGRMSQAEKLFDEMPVRVRDSVSWTTMLSGYVQNGIYARSVETFSLMLRESNDRGENYDPFSFTSVMKACGSLGYTRLGVQLHALVVKLGFGMQTCIQNSLVGMYVKCGDIGLAKSVFFEIERPSLFCWNSMIYGYSQTYGPYKAFQIFSRMPERDEVSWNTMISIFSQHGFGVQCLAMFVEMCNQGFSPNFMTYGSVLSACAGISDLEWGAHLHARIIRTEHGLDLVLGNGLIDMYAKCGCLGLAKRVFNSLREHDHVSWNSLIAGVANFGLDEDALILFNQMRQSSTVLDEFILPTVLGVCSGQNYAATGELLHGYTIKSGMDSSVPVGNAIITMYAKCGDTDKANLVFRSMPLRNTISWTAMITAFSRSGDIDKAQEYFDTMPERNTVTWNSMLSTYVQNGFSEEGLKLYVSMRNYGVQPDWITFTTSIRACADLAIVKLGTQVVSHATKFGLSSNVSVANSIVTMYSRCGLIKEAKNAFGSIDAKDLISWNAMLAAFAQNGLGRKVIETFEDMLRTKCKPDHISYVSVLSGCSHMGLVVEGKHYFDSMTQVFGISPTNEHFACMVDLLGRAGLLEQAKNLIEGMPFKPNAIVWGSLLGACRIHRDLRLAETAAKKLMELDVEDSGGYVLLANIYGETGELENVADMRKLMKAKGIRKSPGCSWIEVDNRVHVFTVDDTDHPQIKEVYIKLEEMMKKIEDTGKYISVDSSVHRNQKYHSEKLAFAFGLLNLPPWMPIHVMKNLRVCDDCHLVIKLFSLVTSRELIMRDGYRFHHFKDGVCSCKDYW
ncbi:pentatricopeptide repeat-containing protein At2g13600-like [Cicer arietinum]|uniref:Pentatricopeptide repeat-containing protein At2g13600-like isoform X1 n=2 Tax=Cicer arietinum TaxID=3827 RepID=A0A1S3EC59_CICAR|nr:pentatricopeptide repeat-containing protein At2g13600-like isoform X1 [Cicer arietinum]XP_004506736.1 pentatricopeptide repeat-containing protein At2g13600-like isoform X1 [Cicer arietinum]XP_012573002.1 pentatricopeptide repeat-containing protein At2g13600-like isoform X1 [Cicer arietinum]XP_012573003.1 pentatricopeptide repeat-containing protein At2g13600-like isoform X1 [Cicer arietinum]XP_012573004.1 pentatricopeptide repeat-containing protein At2g13600-like isoform X1 [Cicer arietinum]